MRDTGSPTHLASRCSPWRLLLIAAAAAGFTVLLELLRTPAPKPPPAAQEERAEIGRVELTPVGVRPRLRSRSFRSA